MDPYETLALSRWSLAAAFVFGTLWGSFANVCIYRWPPTEAHPKGRSVVTPGSHCFACGKPVRWYDNVPLLSYLWLRGKCRDCGAGFSPRYLLVEALTGVLFAVMWWHAVVAGSPFEVLESRLVRFFVLASFSTVLVIITFIDLDHKLILDKVTYPAIPAFYGLGMMLPERQWPDGLIGAAVGYLIVRLIADGYYMLTKREGMGYGDGKLLAVIGAAFGWKAVLVSLFGGALLGSVVGIAMMVRQRGEDDGGEEAGDEEGEEGEEGEEEEESIRHAEVPFGPFLATAAIGYVLAEPWLQARFLGFG